MILEAIALEYGVRNYERITAIKQRIKKFDYGDVEWIEAMLEESARVFRDGNLEDIVDVLLMASAMATEHDYAVRYAKMGETSLGSLIREEDIDLKFALTAHEVALAAYFKGLDRANALELHVHDDNKPQMIMLHALLDNYGVDGDGKTADALLKRVENHLLPELMARRMEISELRKNG